MNSVYENKVQFRNIRLFTILILFLICASKIALSFENYNALGFDDVEDQMLAYYPLDGHADDMSINANHGVINGAIAGKDFRELDDSSLQFDGMDDKVTISSIGDWGNNLSLSFWAYANYSGQNQPQILIGSRDFGNSATKVNFYIAIREAGNMRWIIASEGVNSDIETETKFPTNQWVHVVADWSIDNDTMNIYWNGQLIKSGSTGDIPRYLTNSDIGIGHFCDGCGLGTSYFDGRLDDLRIHSRLLTQNEIPSLAGITANYSFDGHTLDESGNENNATNFDAMPTQGLFGENLNSAYVFDGVDDVINAPSLGNWGDEIGFSLWVNPDSSSMGQGQVLLGSRKSGSGSTQANLVLSINDSGNIFWKIYSNGTNSTVQTTTGVIEYDKWNHIACDWSLLTGNMRIFLNGELVETATVGEAPRYLSNDVGIGNYNHNYDRTRAPFHGIIDEVKFYNRVFTHKDVMNLADIIFKNNFE